MMTKSEVLQLNEPSDIWEEMQKNPELKKDGEVWLHMTRLSAKKTESGLKRHTVTRMHICIWI